MRSIIILSFLCVFLPGCTTSCAHSDRVDENHPTPAAKDVLPDLEPPKPGKDGKVDPIEQAAYDYERFSSAADKAASRYKTLKRIGREDMLDSQAMWISGIALLVAAVAGFAAFVVPVGKKTLTTAAVGGLIIAACAQAFREAIPYLPWFGGALVLGVGVWAAFNWRKLGQTVQNASDHGERLENWLRDDVLPHVDDKARELIEKTITSVKEESKQQAERMGVHNPLQYLRGKTPSLWQRLFS